jgi:PhnB protein
MSSKVKPIPDGYHAVTPYLIAHDASAAIEYYKKAFGAVEVFRMPSPDGTKIGHAEIRLGDSHVMLADEHPEMGARSPKTVGGCPISLLLYVPNVDEVVAQAVKAGGKLVREVADQFYGDRTGGVEDPFGYTWYVATHVEDVAPEELEKRAKAKGQ